MFARPKYGLNLILMLAAVLCVSREAYAKRLPPPVVPPLTVDGTQFSVRGGHIDRLNPSDAVILVAIDLKTKKQRWATTLYEIKINPGIEDDDVFVKSMRAVDGRLELVNEAGDTIKVDLSNGKVIAGGGRTYNFDPDNEPGRHGSAFGWLAAGVVVLALIVALLWHSRYRIPEDFV